LISFIVETVSNSNGCSGNNVANVNATKPFSPPLFNLAVRKITIFLGYHFVSKLNENKQPITIIVYKHVLF